MRSTDAIKDMIRNPDSGELTDSDIGVNDDTKCACPGDIGRSDCCRFPEQSPGKIAHLAMVH